MRPLILRVLIEQCLSFSAILLLSFLFFAFSSFSGFLLLLKFPLAWLNSSSDYSFHSSAFYWAQNVYRYNLILALLLHVFLYLLSLIISEHSSLGRHLLSLRVCITTIQGFLLLESPLRCQVILSVSTCMLPSLFPFKFLVFFLRCVYLVF